MRDTARRLCKFDHIRWVRIGRSAAHSYPSHSTSQINLLGSVSASLLPTLPADWTTDLMAGDATGAWALRPHTAAEVQQVGVDGQTMVLAAQTKLGGLSAQVEAATTLVISTPPR